MKTLLIIATAVAMSSVGFAAETAAPAAAAPAAAPAGPAEPAAAPAAHGQNMMMMHSKGKHKASKETIKKCRAEHKGDKKAYKECLNAAH